VGHQFDGDLLVIGRAVNGWVTHITAHEARDRQIVAARTAEARANAERDGLRWVTDLGNRSGYNTNHSAFWRFARSVALAGHSDGERRARWSVYIGWTNLYKAAPAEGWNPGGDFLSNQTEVGCDLIAREIAELRPRRVLVLAGRWWFEPFSEHLDLAPEWRDGLVEGLAERDGRAFVVSKHPMGKPERRLVDEISHGFAELHGDPSGRVTAG
jgi:hypothetical protein